MRSAKGTAVFSGAGISGDAPASLPRGFGLRDDLLLLIHSAAQESLGSQVTGEQLGDLLASTRKLEVVLARLSGAAGTVAADCLLALKVRVPNEAHLLAALHLMLGGTHLTLNFDTGVEQAYQLLAGGSAATAGLTEPWRSALSNWQTLVPQQVPPLRVVASHAEFDVWTASGEPPALLKIHGSLSADQRHLVDVVVLDIDELGQLTSSRRAAVDSLASASRLLVTGYSGADPDVYEPLISAAQGSRSSWCCFSLPSDSPVPADLHARGIALSTGEPSGMAVAALRELLGLAAGPSWPGEPLTGPGYRERFDEWADAFRATHPPDKIAVAWAWLFADAGDLDTAERMLGELAGRESADAGVLLRYAEVLYTRARTGDRADAEALYRQVAADRRADLGTRLMSRLRLADVSRGQAIRGGGRASAVALLRAFREPLIVLVATRGGRSEPEAAADAYRALQQTSLRLLERAAGIAPTWSWPALARLCRAARLLGRPAERLAGNGNRRVLIRQHRLLLAAYACLLSGRQPPAGLRRDAQSLRNAYRTADDFPGCGNLAVTLAVLAAAEGDQGSTDRLLAQAHEDYAAGRPDAKPIASGQAQLQAVQRLLSRLR